MSASTSPLPYTGNKRCIINTILAVMPEHSVYIEPCCGSAEIFFSKPRAEKEIINDYPQIVDEEAFRLAAQQADTRKKFLPPDSPAENILENKVFCSCGSRLRKNSANRWVCAECRNDGIAEKKMLALICNAFELIADDPSIIQVEPKDQEYTPSTEILRLNSEIRRRIDLAEPEEAESVKSDILQCALLKYQSFEEDLTPYISKTLSEEFAAETPIEESCPLLIKKTVSSIMLADHNRLQIKLRNGAIITTGRDD